MIPREWSRCLLAGLCLRVVYSPCRLPYNDTPAFLACWSPPPSRVVHQPRTAWVGHKSQHSPRANTAPPPHQHSLPPARPMGGVRNVEMMPQSERLSYVKTGVGGFHSATPLHISNTTHYCSRATGKRMAHEPIWLPTFSSPTEEAAICVWISLRQQRSSNLMTPLRSPARLLSGCTTAWSGR